MADEVFFGANTNFPEVADQIVASIQKVNAALSQQQKQQGTVGNVPPQQVVQQLQQQMAQVGNQAAAQMEQLAARYRQSMEQAARTGGRFERPTQQTFEREARQITKNAGAQLEAQLKTAMDQLPAGINPQALRSIAQAGGAQMFTSIQGVYAALRSSLEQAAAAARAGGATGIPTMPAELQVKSHAAQTVRDLGRDPLEGAVQRLGQARATIDQATQSSQAGVQRAARGVGVSAERLIGAVRANMDAAGQAIKPHGARFVARDTIATGDPTRDPRFFRLSRDEETGRVSADRIRDPITDPQLTQTARRQQQQLLSSWERQARAVQRETEQTESRAQAMGRAQVRAERINQRAETAQQLSLARQQGVLTSIDARHSMVGGQVFRHMPDAEGREQARQLTPGTQAYDRAMETRARNVERTSREEQAAAQRMGRLQEQAVRENVARTLGRQAFDQGQRLGTGVAGGYFRVGQDWMQVRMGGPEGTVPMGTLQTDPRVVQDLNQRMLQQQQRAAQAQAKAQQQQQRQQAQQVPPVPPGGGPGGPGGPGRFDRFFGGAADRGGLDVESVAGAAARYARYTMLAAAIYGVQSAFRAAKAEAIDFAESVTDLEVAVGDGTRVTQGWINELQQIARLAGANVGQAMDTAARGVRAFTDVLSDTPEIIRSAGTETARAAERLAIIADKDIGSAVGDIIAIGSSFDLDVDELDRVVQAIAGAKALGGDPGQTSQGLSNAATAFAEAGFNLNEAASVISVVQARLDQTGQATATRLARVFQIARGAQVQALFAQYGVGGDTIAEQIREFARMRDAGQITEGQERRVFHSLGGTANARELIALMNNYGAVTQNVNDLILDGGRAVDEYDRKINNLSGTFRKLQGDLKGITTGLQQSGAFAPIGALLLGTEATLKSVSDLLGLLNLLNEIPGGEQVKTAAISGAEVWGGMALMGVINRRRAVSAARAGELVPMPLGGGLFGRRAQAFQHQRMLDAAGVNAWAIGGPRHLERLDAAGNVLPQGAPSRQIGRMARFGAAADSLMRSPVGIAAGIMAAATAVQGVVQSLERMRQAADRSRVAVDRLSSADSASAFEQAAQAASAAAEEHLSASRGLWGTITRRFFVAPGGQPFDREQEPSGAWRAFDRAMGAAARSPQFAPVTWAWSNTIGRLMGPDGDPVEESASAMRAAEAAARFAQELRDVETELAQTGSALVFGTHLRSIEDLERGLASLEAAGKSATSTVEAMHAALGNLGEDMPPGTILPGSDEVGLMYGVQLAASLEESVVEGFRRQRAAGALKRPFEDADRRDVNRVLNDPELTAQGRAARLSALAENDLARVGAATRAGNETRLRRLREELGDNAVEYYQRIAEEREKADEESAKALEALGGPEEIQAFQEGLARFFASYIEALGIGAEGGQLSEEEMQEIAAQYADEMAEELGEARDHVYNVILERLRTLTDPSALILDQATSNEVQKALVARAPMVGEEYGLTTAEDSVEMARRELEVLNSAAQAAIDSGTEVSEQTKLAILRGERKVADALSRRAGLRAKQAQDFLSEAQVTERTAIDLQEANRLLGEAISRGNKDDEIRIKGEIAALERRQRREITEAAQATAVASLDPRAERARAAQSVTAARAAISDLAAEEGLFDSFGRMTKEYADAIERLNQAIQSQRESLRALRDAVGRAFIHPSDAHGEAHEAVRAAQRRLADALPGEREWYEAYRALQDARFALAQENVRLAFSFARSRVSSRDTLTNARLAVEEQRALIRTMPAGGDPQQTTMRNEALRQLDELMFAERQAQVDFADAFRRAHMDYGDEGAGRQADLERAKDQLAIEVYDTEGYWRALADLRRIEQEMADEALKRADIIRRSTEDPRSAIQRATNDLTFAQERLAFYEEDSLNWWVAQRDLRVAQIALSDAQIQAASNARLLAGDITDPVLQATEAVRTARERLAAAAGEQDAPQDVIDALSLDVVRAEADAERAAFDQRMRAAQTANQLGRMSHAAYISYLEEEAERLRNIADRTQQQQDMLDQIDLAIKAANDGMQGQFNLGDIRVPTPYEVRRAIAAQAGELVGPEHRSAVSTTYHNNVTINGADFNRVIEYLTHVLGAQSTSRKAVYSTRKV